MWENKYEQKWCLFGGTARLHTKTGLVRTVRIQRFTIRNVKKKKKKNSPWINQLCSVLRTQCSSQETRISKANRSHFSTEVSLAVTVIGVTLKILTVRTCCIGLEKKKSYMSISVKWEVAKISAGWNWRATTVVVQCCVGCTLLTHKRERGDQTLKLSADIANLWARRQSN